MASCNRNEAVNNGEPLSSNLNTQHFEKADLDGMITPMAQSFGFTGKASDIGTQLNYTYRVWAEPVQINLNNFTPFKTSGVPSGSSLVDLTATAAFAVKDMVFVTWHAHTEGGRNSGSYNLNVGGPLVGGSITAYKQVGIGQYEFTDRVDFFDADYHEVHAAVNDETGNYEVFMAGQRAQTYSDYLLASHSGAVVTRIDYDYINDEFFEGSVREIPLPGNSVNDIVGAGKRIYVTTGNVSGGEGAVYELDRTLSNVNKQWVEDDYSGRALAIDNRSATVNSAEVFWLGVDGSNGRLGQFSTSWPLPTSTSSTWNGVVNTVANTAALNSPELAERGDLTIASSPDNPFTTTVVDPIFRNDNRILISVPSSSTGDQTLYNLAGASINAAAGLDKGAVISTEYDSSLDVLYLAMAGNGATAGKAIKVLAMSAFAAQSVLVDEYDVIGEFVAPSLGSKLTSYGATLTPTIDDVKEITVFGSRNIALAAGDYGVYFIQRDKF